MSFWQCPFLQPASILSTSLLWSLWSTGLNQTMYSIEKTRAVIISDKYIVWRIRSRVQAWYYNGIGISSHKSIMGSLHWKSHQYPLLRTTKCSLQRECGRESRRRCENSGLVDGQMPLNCTCANVKMIRTVGRYSGEPPLSGTELLSSLLDYSSLS